PRLTPLAVEDVARLGELDPVKVDFVAETIATVRASLDREVAVIGFAGGPITLLAYLLEGGGSQQFANVRRAVNSDAVAEALAVLTQATRAYLVAQIKAGADVVQLFDTWASLLSTDQFEQWAVPSAHQTLVGLGVPTLYFAPGATHLLELFHLVGSTAYGVDWRLPLGEAWRRVGEDTPLQGNLDPAVLLCDPETVRGATLRVLEEAGSRPGHIFNLGHGILPGTPLVGVETMVKTVVSWDGADSVDALSKVQHER
ncbi:MAG TPA: uroporphyrinogen decarboxylase family protein, partial [Acidimicrobiia bacterium]|nr:uroporphyrinogen decarboxylase family protein [Acidimicrobiia bacterium]